MDEHRADVGRAHAAVLQPYSDGIIVGIKVAPSGGDKFIGKGSDISATAAANRIKVADTWMGARMAGLVEGTDAAEHVTAHIRVLAINQAGEDAPAAEVDRVEHSLWNQLWEEMAEFRILAAVTGVASVRPTLLQEDAPETP